MQLWCLALLPVALAACHTAPMATTRNVTYTGRYLAEFSEELFLGIPLARAGRLKSPAPLNESWQGSRSAEQYGAICPCPASNKCVRNANVTGKSDGCLDLNIIRPSLATLKSRTAKLPDAVWLYGGGFADGFGADLTSNFLWVVQASVAQGMPIMAVTFNYRTGFPGFPGGEEVAAAGVTNLGLKDQRQAVRWAMLCGQSVGANSIIYQLLAYGGRGGEEKLFRGAIMSSGLHRHRQQHTPDQVFAASQATTTQPTWWPTIDGDFLTTPPTLQLQAGLFPRDVSILKGTNSDDGFALTNAPTPLIPTGNMSTERLRPNPRPGRRALSLNSPLSAACRRRTRYTYRFDTYLTRPTSSPMDPTLEQQSGFVAGHSAEYADCFRFRSRAHRALSGVISGMLVAFTPMCPPGPPKYSVESPSNLVLDATMVPDALHIHVEPDTWREEGMALWAEYPLELDLGVEW
ncbi:Alpha/Beta hydrolase protein [Parachaetomium inaequale]|uniref:Alpha/Beta hydrolase protein n=1 Tax=Parachaetomium inaequale TaxID=2588326 RepID=A0AAN6P9U3_9PEZI|nr:Alpha/Beta hydrolase protein [Parachaetomium inaequale]